MNEGWKCVIGVISGALAVNLPRVVMMIVRYRQDEEFSPDDGIKSIKLGIAAGVVLLAVICLTEWLR